MENLELAVILSANDDLLRALNTASRWRHHGRGDVVTVIDLGAPGSDARVRFWMLSTSPMQKR